MFDTKNINITKILSVLHINREGKNISSLSYNGNLRAYELILTISGENYTHFGGKILHNISGTVEFLPKGKKDCNYTVDIVSVGDSIDIVFDTDTILPTEAMTLNTAKNETIRKLFGRMSMLWISGSDDDYFSYRCLAAFYEILAELHQIHLHCGTKESLLTQIRPAVEYMMLHFQESDLSCSALGEMCGMSYSYFRRIFTATYKMPPVKYLTRIRVNHACELLRNGSFPITDVAAMSGYDNIYYFSRVFRKETGFSPSDYRTSLIVPEAKERK